MTTIGYESIEDKLLSLIDPNTWGSIWTVPGVSSPKINAGVSIYNETTWGWWGTWISWWSTNITWTATDYNTVSWSSGYIYLPDGTSLSVSSWSTGDMGWMTYIYYDRDLSSVQTTSSAQTSVWENKILLCVAAPVVSWKEAEFQAFWTNGQSTFITADNIAANTITANEIASNTITASQIATGTITADKMNVSTLSAITANMWDVHVWVTSSWDANKSGIRIFPDTSNGKIDFYYNLNKVWEIMWADVWWVWNAIYVIGWNGTWYIALGWNTICLGKLKIPVWTDLYW